ncbi:hypothetical protein HNY73_019373 [Argiope bruennichi]|uniref:Uncharacterized protein n=1 Tax=Argiope bruennichi TaxID=94029 RepID=A0A8T0EJH5_ARGBR|nr:hypothetical protein HNY73_019373 [Argiope bruennichi]
MLKAALTTSRVTQARDFKIRQEQLHHRIPFQNFISLLNSEISPLIVSEISLKVRKISLDPVFIYPTQLGSAMASGKKRETASEKRREFTSTKRRLPKENWKIHDHYDRRMNYGNILTRSQTPFNRIKNTNSDMDFFADGVLHHPSTKPHLMVSMVGENGAIPRTIVTRSAAKQLQLDKKLLQALKEYKKLSKTDPLIKELKEYQKENPNLLNPEGAVEEVMESEEQSSAEQKASSGYESTTGGETTDSESSA